MSRIAGGFAILSLMTNAAIQKVVEKTAISHNVTYNITDSRGFGLLQDIESTLNNTLDEYGNRLSNSSNWMNTTDSSDYLNETLNSTVTVLEWTSGVRPVKRIHVATTLIFLAGCIQVPCFITFEAWLCEFVNAFY
jgi:hypothetical protein